MTGSEVCSDEGGKGTFQLQQGRAHVTPDDVRAIAPDRLRHRLILTYEAAADGISPDQVVAEVVKRVAIP